MTPQDWMFVLGAVAIAVLQLIGQLRDYFDKKETKRMASISDLIDKKIGVK